MVQLDTSNAHRTYSPIEIVPSVNGTDEPLPRDAELFFRGTVLVRLFWARCIAIPPFEILYIRIVCSRYEGADLDAIRAMG